MMTVNDCFFWDSNKEKDSNTPLIIKSIISFGYIRYVDVRWLLFTLIVVVGRSKKQFIYSITPVLSQRMSAHTPL